MRFFKWASSSFIGHIVLFELVGSVPMFFVFVSVAHSEGTLASAWVVYLAVIWAVLGAAGAALVWHTVSLPLIRRRRK